MARALRTVEQMIAELRILKRDTDNNNPQWSDAELRMYLKRAAGQLWNLMLGDNLMRTWLHVVSAPKALVSNVDHYPLPSDCGYLDGVEMRQTAGTKYATLTCGTAGSVTFGDWAAITNGSFRVNIDERVIDVRGIVLTGAASMAAVATLLQTALRAAGGGDETVTYSTDKFLVTGYSQIRPLETVPVPTGYTQTDLSAAAWMNGQTGGTGVAVTVTTGVPTWTRLTQQETPPAGVFARSSVWDLYPPVAGATGPAYFAQNATDGYIRIGPPQTTASQLYRFRYYRVPEFPTTDTDFFYRLPDGVDDMIEALSASLVSHEELEDGRPIGVFGQLFAQYYEAMKAGRGDRFRENRRRIPTERQAQRQQQGE